MDDLRLAWRGCKKILYVRHLPLDESLFGWLLIHHRSGFHTHDIILVMHVQGLLRLSRELCKLLLLVNRAM